MRILCELRVSDVYKGRTVRETHLTRYGLLEECGRRAVEKVDGVGGRNKRVVHEGVQYKRVYVQHGAKKRQLDVDRIATESVCTRKGGRSLLAMQVDENGCVASNVSSQT